MTANVAALVNRATAVPAFDGLLDLYNSFVDRPRSERRQMRRALEVVKDEKLLDLRSLFALPEAWNEDTTPAIAIAPMKWKVVRFTNWMNRSAGFHPAEPSFASLEQYHVVRVPNPPATHHHQLEATVPPTPRSVAPRWSWQRRNCFVLFDTPVWRRVAPVDPFLLKRVNDNQFRVLGQWDLTERERELMQLMGL